MNRANSSDEFLPALGQEGSNGQDGAGGGAPVSGFWSVLALCLFWAVTSSTVYSAAVLEGWWRLLRSARLL